MDILLFTPCPGSKKLIALTSASQSVALDANGTSVHIVNMGNITAYVNLGASGMTAAATDFPLLVNQSVIMPKGSSVNGSAITIGTPAGNVAFTTGYGNFLGT